MNNEESFFQTTALKAEADEIAPDGSEIRLLLRMKHGSLCHCKLLPRMTSVPVMHRQVEEIWYVLSGEAEVWRKNASEEETVCVSPGSCLTIPPRTAFQFRNIGDCQLCICIVTMPPWPGPQEAEKIEGIWPVRYGAVAARDKETASIVAEKGTQARERSKRK